MEPELAKNLGVGGILAYLLIKEISKFFQRHKSDEMKVADNVKCLNDEIIRQTEMIRDVCEDCKACRVEIRSISEKLITLVAKLNGKPSN